MNKTYTLRVRLLSRAVIASAEGYGALIDMDIMFDDVGIPYIPARRIKGCLRDSAIEVLDMLCHAGITDFIDLSQDGYDKFKYKIVNEIFGKSGMKSNSPLLISNLNINDYLNVKQWLDYLKQAEASRNFISKDAVIAYFTYITQQTAIDNDTGTAKRHSLRTVRSIREGIEFSGKIELTDSNGSYEKLLALAVMNLRYIGSMRTRGFGKVKCKIDGINCDTLLKSLEGLCIN